MDATGDCQWEGIDGSVNATYLLSEIEQSAVEALYERAPSGDKSFLPAYMAKWNGKYMVFVEDKTVGFASVNWTRLDARLNQGPVPATADLKFSEEESSRFLVSVHLRDL